MAPCGRSPAVAHVAGAVAAPFGLVLEGFRGVDELNRMGFRWVSCGIRGLNGMRCARDTYGGTMRSFRKLFMVVSKVRFLGIVVGCREGSRTVHSGLPPLGTSRKGRTAAQVRKISVAGFSGSFPGLLIARSCWCTGANSVGRFWENILKRPGGLWHSEDRLRRSM